MQITKNEELRKETNSLIKYTHDHSGKLIVTDAILQAITILPNLTSNEIAVPLQLMGYV